MSGREADSPSGRPATTVAVVAVLALMIGLVAAAGRLRDPYYAILHLTGYVVVFGYVVARLRACLQMARRPEWKSRLRLVAFWLGLSAIGALRHVRTVYRTTDRDFVRLATDACLLFALLYCLELVNLLLARSDDTTVDRP